MQLQRREFLLLERLVRHAGEVVTRTMLLETAWDYEFEARGNIVDMHIHRLRQKIDHGFAYALIQTVPGTGYMVREPDRAEGNPDPPAGGNLFHLRAKLAPRPSRHIALPPG